MALKTNVLDLFEKRVQLQEQLKASLIHQQDQLVSNQVSQLNDITGTQISILETLQVYEMAWKDLLGEHFSDQELASPPILLSERFKLSETESQTLRRLQNRLKELLTEVADLRKTNFLLMGHSLNFVRELFNRLADHTDSGAVYRKDLKSAPSNVLINRTL